MFISFDIFEHAFYFTYAVNGVVLADNVLSSFDGQVCGFGTGNCDVYNVEAYESKKRFNVGVSAVNLPTKDADEEGCDLQESDKTYSSVTTKVEIWALESSGEE